MRKKISMPTVSLLTAQFLFNVSSVALIVGALAVFAGTIGTVWMGSVKERYGDERIAANEAITAGANEAAGKANERAAELGLELEKERTARLLIEDRVRNQGEQVSNLMPRRLGHDQVQKLTALLSKTPRSIVVGHDIAAGDSKLIASDIAEAFQLAEWKVFTSERAGVGNPPPTGLSLRVTNVTSLTESEKQVKDAFEEIGVRFDIQTGRSSAPVGATSAPIPTRVPIEFIPEVELIVTSKMR